MNIHVTANTAVSLDSCRH